MQFVFSSWVHSTSIPTGKICNLSFQAGFIPLLYPQVRQALSLQVGFIPRLYPQIRQALITSVGFIPLLYPQVTSSWVHSTSLPTVPLQLGLPIDKRGVLWHFKLGLFQFYTHKSLQVGFIPLLYPLCHFKQVYSTSMPIDKRGTLALQAGFMPVQYPQVTSSWVHSTSLPKGKKALCHFKLGSFHFYTYWYDRYFGTSSRIHSTSIPIGKIGTIRNFKLGSFHFYTHW